MNWLDIIIVVGLIINVVISLKRGLVRELFSVMGIILGVVISSRFYQELNWFSGLIKNPGIVKVLSFILIFLGVAIIVNLIGLVLNKIFKWSALGMLDHLGGFIFGFIKGIMITGIVLFLLAKFPPMSEIINKSPVASAILRFVNNIITLIWNKPEITEYI